MAVKAKYIKDLPLKENLEGTDSLILQDDEGTKRSTVEAIGGKIAKEANKRVDELEKELVQTNTQLSQKANSNEVVKKGYGTLNDFDESTRALLQGLSDGEVQINAVLGEENVMNKNLAPGSVSGDKLGQGTLKVKYCHNFFDASTVTRGYFISYGNGALQANSSYNASDFILIDNKAEYEQSQWTHYAFYDSNKSFISGIRGDSVAEPLKISNIPTNAKYIRVSGRLDLGFESYYLIDANSDKSSIGKLVIPKLVDNQEVILEENFIGTSAIQDKAVTVDKCDDLILRAKMSKNLFNPNTVTRGYFTNWQSGGITANEKYMVSDYIKVEPNTTYMPSKRTHTTLYDANKKFTRGWRDTEAPSDAITTTSNEHYIRITLNNNDSELSSYQLEKGTERTEYSPYGYSVVDTINGSPITFPVNVPETDKFKTSRLYGKKVSWYGTSITQGYAWCQLVNNAFSFNATNNGVGGTAICKENDNSSMCTKNRMLGKYSSVTDSNTGEVTLTGTPIPDDVEVIFVEGGTNDWARNWIIGDKEFTENPNDQTFAGACHLMFKNMTELFPNAEIIVVGSPFGKMKNRASFTNKYGVLNNQNLQTVEYGDILLDIAGRWGIKGFNMGRVSGVHDNNVAKLIPDGLHLTTAEVQQRTANAIIEYLLTLN